MTLIILKSIAQFSFWYYIGIILYTSIDSGQYGIYLKSKLNYIKNISFIKLFIIILTMYIILTFFTQFCIIMTLDSYLIPNTEQSQLISNLLGNGTEASISESTNNTNLSNNTSTSTQTSNSNVGTDSSNNQNTTSTANNRGTIQSKGSPLYSPQKDYAGRAKDGIIMATALASASKMAQHVPTVAGKTATLAGGIVIGSMAIAATNLSGNVTKDLGKGNSYIPFEATMTEMLNLTGNNFLDLIKLIQGMQEVSLFFSILALYYFVLFNINIDKIEILLLRFFPKLFVQYCIKYINYFKKAGFVLIICFLILNICGTFLAYHYLDFIVENYDAIIEYYKNI